MRKSRILIIVILLFALSLRLYRIREYQTFLGDEGRDALVVKRMIVDHQWTLLGPITSVGTMYMGPIYYYMMLPSMWLTHLDPVGPALVVATLSVATAGLIFLLCRTYWGDRSGLIAAFLYALSPLAIMYGRSSWNPNVVPFFSVLAIFSILRFRSCNRFRWLVLSGICLGFLIQLHYVTLLLTPLIIWLLIRSKSGGNLKTIGAFSIGFIGGFSPFLAFEIRHQFVNTRQVIIFILQQKSESGFNLMKSFSVVEDILVRLFWRLIVIENAELTKIFIAIVGICVIIGMIRSKKNGERRLLQVVCGWLLCGLGAFSLYRGIIYDYYLGCLFAVPFLLSGYVLSKLSTFSFLGRIASWLTALIITIFMVSHSPLKLEPNNLVRNTEMISQFVVDKTEGKPFNFALMAGRNSDHAYRFFFEVWNRKPQTIENPINDPNRQTVTDQLLIVCEEKICSPLGQSLWEIAGFGRAEIENEWSVSTVKVFKLKHYQG